MFDIINNNNYILYSVYILIFLRYSIFKLLLSLYVPLLLFSIHFVVLCILAGEKLVKGVNVRSIRPAAGLHTRYWPEVLASTATRDIARAEPLDWSMLSVKKE
jgi:hypothetical protein